MTECRGSWKFLHMNSYAQNYLLPTNKSYTYQLLFVCVCAIRMPKCVRLTNNSPEKFFVC